MTVWVAVDDRGQGSAPVLGVFVSEKAALAARIARSGYEIHPVGSLERDRAVSWKFCEIEAHEVEP